MQENFPKPPFAEQQQPHPGFSSRMTPQPDHGEASYRGSQRLEGKKTLITGGDSGIGRAVALAFAREGADVAISYLSEEEDAERSGGSSRIAAGSACFCRATSPIPRIAGR
jgi:hypothetical protein